MPTILITGCSTGIGHAACALFAERGWTVYAGSRAPEQLSFNEGLDKDSLEVRSNLGGEAKLQEACGRRGLASEGGSTSGCVQPCSLDVNSITSITACFEELRKKGASLDCVVNNAGFGIALPFENTPREEIEEMFRVNVFGLMEVCRQAGAMMRDPSTSLGAGQIPRTIINISSVVGQVGYPFYAAYCATKWAVEGFSEALAHEMRPFGIRVKIVEPGRIRTDFHKRAYDDREAQHVTEPWTEMYERKKAGHAKSFLIPGRTLGPEAVASVIYRAATDGKRKLRYRVGNDTRILCLLKKLLPEQIAFEMFHRRFM